MSGAGAAPDGGQLFAEHCAVCHGDKGSGGVGTPLALPSPGPLSPGVPSPFWPSPVWGPSVGGVTPLSSYTLVPLAHAPRARARTRGPIQLTPMGTRRTVKFLII